MKSIKSALKSNALIRRIYHRLNAGRDYTSLWLKNIWSRISWRLNKPGLPESDGVYVHLGCGEINHPKMINIDLRPERHIHYLHGVEDLPMFKDNTVDLIYISHCLEHVSHLRLYEVLNEWNRVLKPNGILRISVPNFETILEIYKDSNYDLDEILQPMLGGQDYKYNFHYSAFDSKYLTKILEQSGFGSVKPWNKGDDDFTNFDDWSNRGIMFKDKEYKISLNIQGVKRSEQSEQL